MYYTSELFGIEKDAKEQITFKLPCRDNGRLSNLVLLSKNNYKIIIQIRNDITDLFIWSDCPS